METVKIVVGLGIIIASFAYVLKNKGSMLDNLLRKNKEEYEKKMAIQEKAHMVVDGKADAFETIVDSVKEVLKKEESNNIAEREDDSYINSVFKYVSKCEDVTKFVVEEPSLNEIFVSKVGESYEK